jgi:hypothetical protein
MPVVDAEPERGPQGPSSLRKICLDRAIDAMLNEPGPHHTFNTLPWNMQQEILSKLVEDRRERLRMEEQVYNVPLIDREKHNNVDENSRFIKNHPEDFKQNDFLGLDEINLFWSNFLRAADRLQSEAAAEAEECNEYGIHLIENTNDSLVRFSICTTFGDQPIQHDSCSRLKHCRLGDLITPGLLVSRLTVLRFARGCDLTKDDFHITWTHGDLVVEVDTNMDDGEPAEPYIWAYFEGDMHCLRSAEVYLNALLSPLETIDGRIAFAKRYMKLVDLTSTSSAPMMI